MATKMQKKADKKEARKKEAKKMVERKDHKMEAMKKKR